MTPRAQSASLSTALLAIVTLCCFAANSVLCRLGLASGSIGPLEFTAVRISSGVGALLVLSPLISRLRDPFGAEIDKSGNLKFEKPYIWTVAALFVYALFFSLAYTQLPASVGALILFASIQITMIGSAIAGGQRMSGVEWLGLFTALVGLVYLLLPGLSEPPLLGTIFMIIAGISWGVYSLVVAKLGDPIIATTRNFLFSLPAVAVLIAVVGWRMFWYGHLNVSLYGILIGILSGALASGIGYILWYVTLKKLSTTDASVAQLAVPVITALGGVLILNERLSTRLVIASLVVIGGIGLTILGRRSTVA